MNTDFGRLDSGGEVQSYLVTIFSVKKSKIIIAKNKKGREAVGDLRRGIKVNSFLGG